MSVPRAIFVLVILFLPAVEVRAQQSPADSAAVLAQAAIRAYQQGSRPALEKSILLLREAAPQLRSAGDLRGEGNVLSSIGAIFQALGRADSSLVYIAQSLRIAREREDRAAEGAALSNLGSVYQALGRLDSALVYDEKALPLLQQAEDRRGEAATLVNIGVVQMGLGRSDTAMAHFGRALVLTRGLEDREPESAVLSNIGMVYQALHQPDSALAYFTRALDVAGPTGNGRVRANTLHNIGFTYLGMGQPATARAYLWQALALLCKIGDRRGEGAVSGTIGLAYQALHDGGTALVHYRRALSIHRDVGHPAAESATLAYFGVLYYRKPHRSAEDLARAVAYFDSSAAVLAEIGHAAGGDQNRLSFSEQDAGLFHLWAFAWLARAPEVGNPDAASAALAASERGRAQALRELMRRSATVPFTTAGGGAPQTLPGTDLIAEGRALASALTRSGVPALSYLVTPDTLLAFLVVPGREVEVVRTSVTQDTLAALVARLRALLRADSAGWRTPAARLSALLLPAGVRARLPASGELVIVPSGPLFLLPFAALPLSEREPASTAFLGLRYALRYSPSLQVLTQLEALPGGARPAADALVVGNPIMPRVPDERGSFFVPSSLLGAGREGRWVAGRVGAPVLSGAGATEAVVRGRLGSATLVHLATHARTFPTDARARDSYIALAPGGGQDGRLTVGEVLDEVAPMRAELVVLSACQTGLGDLKQAEGTVGLQRAFLARGARGVLVSLWSVRDVATTLLMQRFYDSWLGGASRAEALRRAQVDVAGDERFGHPRYWAAFQLVGAR